MATDFVVCGRIVGHFYAWDQIDADVIVIIGLQPVQELGLPPGDTFFDFYHGTITQRVIGSRDNRVLDLVDALSKLPRAFPTDESPRDQS